MGKGFVATSKFANAVANLAKKAGALLGPQLNLLANVWSWGAKDILFLVENLWIFAVLIAYVLYN